jgi:hypothetical protein
MDQTYLSPLANAVRAFITGETVAVPSTRDGYFSIGLPHRPSIT